MDPKTILSAMRVTKVMSGLQDQRGVDAKLVNLSRTPIVAAKDNEILARFIGQILIADLIADGQRAGLYSLGKISVESTSIPNLKLGTALNQDQLNMLLDMMDGIEVRDNLFPSTETRIIDNLRLGVQYRMEALIIASKIGGFSYDRLGIRMDNVDFGMPADLKMTVADEWTDSVNAKPVSNVTYAKRRGSIKYGIEYDRMKLSLAALEAMVATTEFQQKSKLFLRGDITVANLNEADTEYQRNLARSVFGMKEIEITDQRYWAEEKEGAVRSAPFQPSNKVILESTQSDNDASVIDFANGVVTEALISRMPGSPIKGQLPSNARGPVGYQVAEHNPPSASYYGVGRGMPRRHYPQATACLTIAPDTGAGALGDGIEFEEIDFV